MGVEGVDENDIFNLLEDISIKEKINLQNLYPWIHITRPITAPAETAVYHKNIILIGAGSGIAPYLSLLDEQSYMADELCDLNSKRKHFRAFTRCHVIFIVRSSDEISWISNFISKMLNKSAVNSKIQFHIYLTQRKKLQNFLSFRQTVSKKFYEDSLKNAES